MLIKKIGLFASFGGGMGLFSALFGRKPSLKTAVKQLAKQSTKRPTKKKPQSPNTRSIQFPFAIYEADEMVESNRWYQKETWKNKSFVKYDGIWDTDWKRAPEGKVKVAGISHGNRAEDFLGLAPLDSFRMFLEDDPGNPVNKNARKIMASAKIDGDTVVRQVGYLPDEIANKYAGEELDIRPATAFLPQSADVNLGVEVALLVRSARYLKRKS